MSAILNVQAREREVEKYWYEARQNYDAAKGFMKEAAKFYRLDTWSSKFDNIELVRAARTRLREELAKHIKIMTDPELVPDEMLSEEYNKLRQRIADFDKELDLLATPEKENEAV